MPNKTHAIKCLKIEYYEQERSCISLYVLDIDNIKSLHLEKRLKKVSKIQNCLIVMKKGEWVSIILHFYIKKSMACCLQVKVPEISSSII